MSLRRLEAADLPLVAGWLATPDNAQWLDFGGGIQTLTPAALAVMNQRDLHLLRLYSDSGGGSPVGIVALSNVSRAVGTAMLWYVLGDKAHGGRGVTTRAVSDLLGVGFGELGLVAVNAWTVEHNLPSQRVLERNGFRFIGRQRACHVIAGRRYDRLLFDLVAGQHELV